MTLDDAPLVEIRNATIFRGRNCVFDGFDLTIRRGEHIAILGPNGAGKTTLIKALNRELYPRADDTTVFRILGRDTWNVWALRRHLGLVSADLQHRYSEHTTVHDVVLSGFLSSIGVHGVAGSAIEPDHRTRADAIIDDLGLTDLAPRRFGSLSTGQQRLALLARALVHEPHTLILDEPAAGLDFKAGFDMQRRVRRLAASGVSLVIVTHHLDEIPPETERIVLLKAGQVIADGVPAQVLTSERLSDAYETPIEVIAADGRFFAVPA